MPEADQPTPPTTDPTELVCHCMAVTRGELAAAIDAGARSVGELQDATAACTGCGTCRFDLLQMLDRCAVDRSREAS